MSTTPARRLHQAITDLAAITDPQEQAVRGHELQEAMKGATADVRRITDAAVAKLRQTKSLAEVAELLGVGPKRVSQMATSTHGVGRQPPNLIYAVRLAGTDTWYGDPDALQKGYETAAWHPKTGTGNQFDGAELEVRYGPVADDMLPSYYAYTTIDGRRLRPTAAVHEVIFGTTE